MRATQSAAQLLVGSSSAPNLHRPGSGSGSRPGSASRLSGALAGAALRRPTHARTCFAAPGGGHLRHEFGYALGEHGLTWEDTIVTNVAGQALKKGIKPGWKILTIDGQRVSNSEEIRGKFQEAKWQWRNCNVGFVTDMIAIRAEQARNRSDKIRAEAERLARLPFEGSHDSRHLEQVKEEFKFQGYIDGAENRALTLPQLARLMEFAASHCHRWRDPRTRQKLHIDGMTVVQIEHWLVKPATWEKDCSFVEMIAKDKQPPAWFVIYMSTETLINLRKYLEAQRNLHGLADTDAFWVSAFAHRPNLTTEELTEAGPKGTAMYRAMALSRFRAVLTLDAKTDFKPPCQVLNRVWCTFEATLLLDDPRVELDISSIQGGKPVVLTRGLSSDEQAAEATNPGMGYKMKESRERSFAVDTIEKALAVTIQKGDATDPTHRDLLLNIVAGRDVAQPALEESDLYTKANKRLRALFALSCWRRVMSVTGDDSMKDLQLAISDAIRNDSLRDSLNLDMAYMNSAATEKMGLLMRSLPPSVKELSLNLTSMNITDEHVVALASAMPPSLEELDLGLTNNVDISNVGIANVLNNMPSRLRKQCLNLHSTATTKEFQDKADSLDGIKQAIYDEAQKGNLCTTVNLLPNKEARGRMAYSTERSKCY